MTSADLLIAVRELINPNYIPTVVVSTTSGTSTFLTPASTQRIVLGAVWLSVTNTAAADKYVVLRMTFSGALTEFCRLQVPAGTTREQTIELSRPLIGDVGTAIQFNRESGFTGTAALTVLTKLV